MKGRRLPAILIFGEDANDQLALDHLIHALCPKDCPRIEKRRSPLILIKGRLPAKQRDNAKDVAAVVRADRVRFQIKAVVAHQDCDAVEPAHVALADNIEKRLVDEGIVEAVAATPAFEMEAWWYLWPDAVAAVNSKWRRLNRKNKDVGLIKEAKETLTRDLRPQKKDVQCPDYRESDAPRIAAQIRLRNLVDQRDATSDSFDRFAKSIRKALAS